MLNATLFIISFATATVNFSSITTVNLNAGIKDENVNVSPKCDTPTTLSSLLSHFYSLLLPVTVILLLSLLCLLYFYLYFCIFKNEKKPKETIRQSDQYNPDIDEFYLYKFIYRIGCPSALFDRENGWVEFQLMKRKDLPFYEPIR